MPPCKNCGAEIPETSTCRARGWCSACYQRWIRHGKPESGPPPPQRAPPPPSMRELARASLARRTDERMRLFRRLDSKRIYGRPALTDTQIAQKMGVSERTVWRYRAAERKAGRGWRKPTGTGWWSGARR